MTTFDWTTAIAECSTHLAGLGNLPPPTAREQMLLALALRMPVYTLLPMSPPPTAATFTPKQAQYLAFIYAYTRVLGRPPSESDLQRHFGVSPPSVHQMVLTLERAGLIRRQPGVARSIEVLVPPELLPVLR